MDLSIVIPVYNEEVNIELMIRKLREIQKELPASHEIIFVNDGSSDSTQEKLLAAKRNFDEIKIVELRKNSGHHVATYAGFDHASGQHVATLDGDLQNDPGDIPRVLNHLITENYDIVCGWRKNRKDSFLLRKLPSLLANRIINHNADYPIHDYGCFLRAYTRRAVEEIRSHVCATIWFPVLFPKLGFRVGELEVTHHERQGKDTSRHNFLTRLHQFISVFFSAVKHPFHFFFMLALIGSLCALLLVLTGLVLLVYAPVIGGILLASGIMLLVWSLIISLLGYIGEFMVRLQSDIDSKPMYYVLKFHE